MIVQLNGVSKSFGSQDVLRDVSFQINPSEKIGLIGANGAGKTTLLKLIGAVHDPDSGSLTRKSALEIGTLDQIPDFHEGTSVLEEGLRASEYLRRIEKQLRELEQSIASAPFFSSSRWSSSAATTSCSLPALTWRSKDRYRHGWESGSPTWRH